MTYMLIVEGTLAESTGWWFGVDLHDEELSCPKSCGEGLIVTGTFAVMKLLLKHSKRNLWFYDYKTASEIDIDLFYHASEYR